MRLPPGVSEDRFEQALDRFAAVVGQDWVFANEEDVDLYRDINTPFTADEEAEYIPSGALAPNSVEQVQEIVRIANEFVVPLWPISCGRNHGYGGSSPRLRGAVMLDLKRMNRVLEVNETLAYALVEPGVSYFDFYRYLRDHKHKVWLDCPDPGWGSLIGNALEHGNGHTPFRDHFDSHCGMEVVLPNGELMRTGCGAIPNSRTWNTYKYGFGPHVSPMFSQSNFGIVTKMGFWLLPEQPAARNYIIEVPLYEQITPFLEVMEYLLCSRILDSCFTVGSWTLGSSIRDIRDPELLDAIRSAAPVEELKKLGAAKNVPYWDTKITFYGPPGVIDAKIAYVQEKIGAIPGAKIGLGESYKFPIDPDTVDDTRDRFEKPSLGIPSLSVFSAVLGKAGQAGYSPVIPATGPDLLRALQVIREAYHELGLGEPHLDIGSWYDRSLVLLMSLFTGPDPEDNRRKRQAFKRLIAILAENGWGAYRCAPLFMDDAMAGCSFNNHALRRFLENLKDAIDPNGILAPGKSGIWPKRLRRN